MEKQSKMTEKQFASIARRFLLKKLEKNDSIFNKNYTNNDFCIKYLVEKTKEKGCRLISEVCNYIEEGEGEKEIATNLKISKKEIVATNLKINIHELYEFEERLCFLII